MPDLRIHLGRRVGLLIGLLLAVNVAAWALTLVVAFRYLAFLGLALTAYLFGLRHSMDADHISAIDNATRKLMHDGRRPVAVGLFFSLGHSTVVFVMAIAITAGSAFIMKGLVSPGSSLKEWGSVIGTGVSVLFLFMIAVMNIGVLREVVRASQRGEGRELRADETSLPRGPLMRVFRGLFRSVDRSWKMYPIGLLFGLGFDTASEVGLLVVSSIAVTRLTLPVPAALLLPLLFTSGMTIADTTDGLAMVGAYSSALRGGSRRLSYNLLVTAASVFSALLIGTIELLQLAADHFDLGGAFWSSIERIGSGSASGYLGAGIVTVLLASWGVSILIRRFTSEGRGVPEA